MGFSLSFVVFSTIRRIPAEEVVKFALTLGNIGFTHKLLVRSSYLLDYTVYLQDGLPNIETMNIALQ